MKRNPALLSKDPYILGEGQLVFSSEAYHWNSGLFM